MARVRLASWYDGSAPGEVVDIPDDVLRPLTRDGRVAEVLPAEPEPEAPVVVEPSTSPEPPSEPPEPARRSRRDSTQ